MDVVVNRVIYACKKDGLLDQSTIVKLAAEHCDEILSGNLFGKTVHTSVIVSLALGGSGGFCKGTDKGC